VLHHRAGHQQAVDVARWVTKLRQNLMECSPARGRLPCGPVSACEKCSGSHEAKRAIDGIGDFTHHTSLSPVRTLERFMDGAEDTVWRACGVHPAGDLVHGKLGDPRTD
jgi:hypothetical protein